MGRPDGRADLAKITVPTLVLCGRQDALTPLELHKEMAAGIAGSRPMATGIESWKIAKGLYIVPLLFAYTPLISGDFIEVMQVAVFSLFGIYATNALIQLYSEGPVGVLEVVVLIVGAALAFWPMMLIANVAGAALVTGVIVWTRVRHARRAAPA